MLAQNSLIARSLGTLNMYLSPDKDAYLIFGAPAKVKALLDEFNKAMRVSDSTNPPLSFVDKVRLLGAFYTHGAFTWKKTCSTLLGRGRAAIEKSRANGFFGIYHAPAASRLLLLLLGGFR
jgi:hypothetical protein